ncbi:MAG: porin family protein [Ginsengibacter sp.]
MKNKTLLIFTLLISSLSYAQQTPTIGIKAGIISSGIQGDMVKTLTGLTDLSNGIITTSNHTGFFTGISTTIPVSNLLSVESGIYYSQKGYELKGALDLKGIDFLGANAKAVLLSQYIDVPILMKANFNGFQVFAGPQLSYLIKSDLKTTAGALGINLLSKTIDASAQFNSWDAAMTGGIGYQFQNGVNITASYDYGLLKIDANRNANAFNHAVKVGIGFNF